MNSTQTSNIAKQMDADQKNIPKAECLITEVPMASRNLATLFLSLLLIGAIGSIWRIEFAVGSLVIYGWVGYRWQRDRLNLDHFGDSLYYMGFLFTLWALLVSIGPFNDAPKDNLIANIGMALLTTLLGLGARVVLIQLQPTRADPVEIEKNIESAAISLQKQLSAAITTLKRNTESSALEIEISQSKLTKKLEDLKNDMAKSGQGLVDKINKIQIPADILDSSLRNASADIEQALNGVAKDIRTGADSLKTVLSDIQINFETVGKSGHAFAQVATDLNKMLLDAERLKFILRKEAENVTAEATRVGAKMAEVSVTGEQLDQSMRKLGESLEITRSDINSIRESVFDIAEVLKKELHESA